VAGAGWATLETLEAAEAHNRWIVDFFRPYLGADNLELGAGRGTLVELVAETHTVVPFEISEPQRKLVEERFAGNSRVAPCRANILDCHDWSSFDCIYSANVLEHIEDDRLVLAHSARLLREGAWCVAFVPAHRALYSKFDKMIGHFRRYDRSDCRRLARIESEGAVLELRTAQYVNIPGAFGWALIMRLLGRTSISRRDADIVGRLVPVIKVLDRLRLPFGQSVVLAWQRSI